MTIDAHDMPRVVVGRTRESAVQAFGQGRDDLFVTTHADFVREVDLDRTHTIDVVADEGYDETLAALAPHAERLAMRLAVRPGGNGPVATTLKRCALRITAIDKASSHVLLAVSPASTGAASEVEALVLRALDAGGRSQAKPTASTAPRKGAAPKVPSWPTPPLVRALDRLGSRGLRLFALGLAGLLVLGVALAIAGLAGGWSARAQLPTMMIVGTVAVVAVAANLVVSLLLARQLHRQTERLARSSTRQVHELRTLVRAIDQRTEQLEEHTARIPFLAEHAQAVAEHSSAASARMRDLLEDLERR